jgi:hypothetical protein
MQLTWLIAKPGTLPPLALHSPSEYDAVHYSVVAARNSNTGRLPRGLLPFSVFMETSSNLPPGLPKPGLGSTLRFSQPLSAFLRLHPPGLVSCRSRSWGLPFRAFPYALAEFPFGISYPHAVFSCCTARCRCANTTRNLELRGRFTQRTAHRRCFMPRLQGFTHLRSPLPSTGGLDRMGPDALLGFLHSRVLTKRYGASGFPERSSHGLTKPGLHAHLGRLPSESRPNRRRAFSLEIALPSCDLLPHRLPVYFVRALALDYRFSSTPDPRYRDPTGTIRASDAPTTGAHTG